jgi:hypothetical protein
VSPAMTAIGISEAKNVFKIIRSSRKRRNICESPAL